jgi:hypothetical protein
MKELIQKLINEANLTDEMAQKAVAVLSDFIKAKVPGPFADQVLGYLQGENVENIKDKMNDLLGGFKL